jgi:hypothetical protein
MQKRGWAPAQIAAAIQAGQPFHAPNHVNPGQSATRYVHPTTGRSVVVNDVSGEEIHVGGDGFLY